MTGIPISCPMAMRPQSQLGISSRSKFFQSAEPIYGLCCDGHRDSFQPCACSFSWVEPGAWIFSCPAPGQPLNGVNHTVISRNCEGAATSQGMPRHPPHLLVFDDFRFGIGIGLPTTYAENLLCLLAGSQARSNIINAYLHPLPSSLGAQGGLPWNSQRSRTHAATCIKPKHLKPPFHSFSLPLFLCTHRTRERWRKHALALLCYSRPLPPPPPSHPQQQTPPNLFPNLRNRSHSQVFQHSALPVGGLACPATITTHFD